MIKHIKDGSTLIAIIGSLDDVAWGNNFITQNDLQLQVGILRKEKGIVKNHLHKMRNRQMKTISQEFHLVIRGKAIVSLFNNAKELIDKELLCPNMYCLLVNGGHGYEIIKDDTLMLECKLGAYTNPEDDKELI
jgi:hypothetical protein